MTHLSFYLMSIYVYQYFFNKTYIIILIHFYVIKNKIRMTDILKYFNLLKSILKLKRKI